VLTGIKQRAAAAPLATAAAALSPAAVAALEAAAAASSQLDTARSELLAVLTAARLPCARRLAYALAVATAALDAAQHREAAAEDSAARAALAAAEAAEQQQLLAAAAAAQSDAPLQDGDSPEELDEEAQLVKALLSKRSERRGELRRLQLDLRAQRMTAVLVQAKREQVLLLLLLLLLLVLHHTSETGACYSTIGILKYFVVVVHSSVRVVIHISEYAANAHAEHVRQVVVAC
jgi:hypothetical protein